MTELERKRISRIGTTLGTLTITGYSKARFYLLCECGKDFNKLANKFESNPVITCSNCATGAFSKSGQYSKEKHVELRDNTPVEDKMIKSWLEKNKPSTVKDRV